MSFDNPQHNQENIDREETPFFSIIIPVFNTQDFIEECLNSCISQTFQNLEILVVDDRGEDQSMQIVQKFASKDSRIKIITHPKNLGLFRTRLSGISQAQGEYCLFVDSDDFVDHQMCETLHQALQKHPVDILQFRMQHFPKVGLKKAPKVTQKKLSQDKMRAFLNLNNAQQSLCDKTFRSETLKQSLKFLNTIQYPLCFMEDGLIVFLTSLYAQTYYGIPNQLYFYRNNPNSMTRQKNPIIYEKKTQDCLALLDIYQNIHNAYPNHQDLIQQYSLKVFSAFVIEARFFDSSCLKKLITQAKTFGFDKQPSHLGNYLNACILSYRYFQRWQTLVRISVYIFSLGKVKL